MLGCLVIVDDTDVVELEVKRPGHAVHARYANIAYLIWQESVLPIGDSRVRDVKEFRKGDFHRLPVGSAACINGSRVLIGERHRVLLGRAQDHHVGSSVTS